MGTIGYFEHITLQAAKPIIGRPGYRLALKGSLFFLNNKQIMAFLEECSVTFLLIRLQKGAELWEWVRQPPFVPPWDQSILMYLVHSRRTLPIRLKFSRHPKRLVQRFSRSVALNVFPPSSVPALCCQINNIWGYSLHLDRRHLEKCHHISFKIFLVLFSMKRIPSDYYKEEWLILKIKQQENKHFLRVLITEWSAGCLI